MAKRSWSEVESSPTALRDVKRASVMSPEYAEANGNAEPHGNGSEEIAIPQISRKVKACAACRKQKIKCLMDESGPPCRRCIDRNLSCVLNKSLQSLLDEKQQLTEAFAHDLLLVHSSLQEVVAKLGMPMLAPLQSSHQDTLPSPITEVLPPTLRKQRQEGPSCDNSPRISPADEDLPYVPIQSVYHLTKMSALRSPSDSEVIRPAPAGAAPPEPTNDFISKGLINEHTAERLFQLYRDRLDHYMYCIGARYKTLAEMRRESPLLTACICTVAALHDPASDGAVYGTCSTEFRRIMAEGMFDRLVHRDALRAMCVAAYWLSDTSWMISGFAIRRAAEFNLHNSFSRVLLEEHSEDAADCLRLWYILYICDQHLATLYGRPSIVQEDLSLQGCERFLECAVATDQDRRLVSQVSLLLILRRIRELFGPDTGKPTPQVYLGQIAAFNSQLDKWIGQWSTTLKERYDRVGGFPRKGALLHYHFARLHLHAHAFRGLRGDSPAVPPHWRDCAATAVASAHAIVDLILTDSDVRAGLVGMPSYLLSMTAFTCMFLIKVAGRYAPSGLADPDRVHDSIARLVVEFRSIPAGKWHLVRLMAGGLEKMLATLKPRGTGTGSTTAAPSTASTSSSTTWVRPPQQQLKHEQQRQQAVNRATTTPAAGPGIFDNGITSPFASGLADDFPPDWADSAGGIPGLDGAMFFDYNMSFGLSPVVNFDPSALGMEGQIRGL